MVDLLDVAIIREKAKNFFHIVGLDLFIFEKCIAPPVLDDVFATL